MKILLRSIGDLRDYFGKEPQEIVFEENATYYDLLSAIDSAWGTKLPPYLWDTKKKQFKGPVFFLLNKEVVMDLNTPLQDGSRVDLLRALVGG